MFYPNFYFEKKAWKRGFQYVAGLDEVGRGALAGPVVAGCVVFSKKTVITLNARQNKFISENLKIKIDDSKRLTARQRRISDLWIKDNCLTWGIGEVKSAEIDRFGIVKATRKAMRKAVGNANQRLQDRINYLLIDAFYLPYIRGIRMPSKNKRIEIKKRKHIPSYGQQTAIVKGDQRSFSIAAASITAKVYRDDLMIELGKRKRNKIYRWDENKGYGTKLHREKIIKYGTVNSHRKTFILK